MFFFVEVAILIRRHTKDSEREIFDWDTNSVSVQSIVIELLLATNIGPNINGHTR